MRHLLLLLSVLLLSVSWVAAQSDQGDRSQTGSSSAGQEKSANTGNQMTVQGCLSGSEGNYTLTDKSGNTYQLTGDTAKLSEHVGHEIKVSGTATTATTSSGGSSGAMGQSSGSSQKAIEVSSVKHMTKTCQSAGTSH
jgi:Protein of unknown function (DUF5818)